MEKQREFTSNFKINVTKKVTLVKRKEDEPFLASKQQVFDMFFFEHEVIPELLEEPEEQAPREKRRNFKVSRKMAAPPRYAFDEWLTELQRYAAIAEERYLNAYECKKAHEAYQNVKRIGKICHQRIELNTSSALYAYLIPQSKGGEIPFSTTSQNLSGLSRGAQKQARGHITWFVEVLLKY